MRILVIGASGGTGSEAVKQALALGHDVTALVRTPERFGVKHERLTVAKGDVLDLASLERALPGHDAVLAPFGPRGLPRGEQTLYTRGGANIIRAMKSSGVKRVVALTSGGVEDDPAPSWFYRRILKPFLLMKAYEDHKRFEEQLRASDLDWVVVRPYELSDGPRTGQYRVSPRFLPAKPAPITRADVADFMLKQAGDTEWLRKTPTIAC